MVWGPHALRRGRWLQLCVLNALDWNPDYEHISTLLVIERLEPLVESLSKNVVITFFTLLT